MAPELRGVLSDSLPLLADEDELKRRGGEAGVGNLFRDAMHEEHANELWDAHKTFASLHRAFSFVTTLFFSPSIVSSSYAE